MRSTAAALVCVAAAALGHHSAGGALPPGAVVSVFAGSAAVAWLLSQKLVTAPIVNAYAPQQVEELVQGVGVRLSRAHLADIARAAE